MHEQNVKGIEGTIALQMKHFEIDLVCFINSSTIQIAGLSDIEYSFGDLW
jgi:hypothetical protein